ncbi:polysaccharide deacetylase family protein [Oleispirillum naphthae]|uniref:polysaccharide deacetylase family protein n=1 Tax=Oleispirillum naphthae TaxID=2838853 RepID=UPI00308266E2
MNASQGFVSVDMDMWCHCRWATGGPASLWPSVAAAEAAMPPRRAFPDLVGDVLDLFDELELKATFFILGEMAQRYPGAARAVAARGHELACHAMHHIDSTALPDADLRNAIRGAKRIIEDVAGQPVVGFRFPNLVYGPREIAMLAEEGFLYDSSACFGRKLQGKFGVSVPAQYAPYRIDPANPFVPGAGPLWEIPIPVFPGLRLPAGTGVATRVFGVWWSRIALARSLRRGKTAVYYFHPYELGDFPEVARLTRYTRLFMRNTGKNYRRMLQSLLPWLQKRAACGTMRGWVEVQRKIGSDELS